MPYGDDDEVAETTSQQEYVTRSDHGKKKSLEKRVREKLSSSKEAKLQQAELRSQMDLNALKEEVSGDREEREDREEEEEQEEKTSRAPKTKTLKENEEEHVATAHDQPTQDILLERQKVAPEMSEEETPSEPG